MEKLSYIATVIDENYVEVRLCDEVPDFVHMVKCDSANNAEVYFSSDVDWTPAQEDIAMEHVLNNSYVMAEI